MGDQVTDALVRIYQRGITIEDSKLLHKQSMLGESKYSWKELDWIIHNYRFWKRLLSSLLARQIFIEYYKRRLNGWQLKTELETKYNKRFNYNAVRYWLLKMKRYQWLWEDMKASYGKEVLYYLNKRYFSRLMKLTYEMIRDEKRYGLKELKNEI
jgi:hypothetical protein